MEGKMEKGPDSQGARKHDTASLDLNGLCSYFNAKISDIKKSLQLRKIDQEPGLKSVVSKIVHETFLLNNLLDKLELELQHQETQQSQLKLQESIEKDYNEAQHLRENMPIHLPRTIPSSIVDVLVKNEHKSAEPENTRKPAKEHKKIKEVSLLMAEEFESVPAYMRGRLRYDQVNTFIGEINKAVASKYRILQQPTRALSRADKNLYFRFQEQETKETKGEFFIVEADIEEFTDLKADKRFHSILTILRHCQRIREIRGSKLVRYAIC
ncbi:spindle and kinetochore-associated protein 1 isoform X2 [Hemicordylus capensis]|uniref:spindle and kinetochore-associated protein 1 isoform X2 n=1 Tax=Hemicordylus capensis TaxID=884348 RepID=UPI002303A497|nr:spindle and kinetochore-associated protein 1 isoform X2 [Hemicordylus capensis]